MKLSFLSGAACAAALLASTSVAQNKLTTLFAGGNGLSGSAAVYFDITVNSTVIVSDFEINSWATAQTAIDLQVYTTPNTYLGNEGNQSVWTQVAQDNGSAVAAGQGTPSVIKLQQALILQPGTYGMALVSNGGHSYTDGTGSNQNYSDNFLSLQLGASSSPPFGGSPFTPRVWNGSIIYNPANGIFANFTATPVEGQSPLQVQFTDKSYSSSDPAGVHQAGPGTSTTTRSSTRPLQNPQFTFTGVGYDKKFTVSLEATDGSNSQPHE
jgi:PKD repeat protein